MDGVHNKNTKSFKVFLEMNRLTVLSSFPQNCIFSLGKIAYKYKFIILFIIVLALVIGQIYNQRWQGDFWQHSAVVSALSDNFVDPGHPRLNINTPYEMYSPYLLLLAFLARGLAIHPIIVLSFFAVLNLVFWFYAMRFFVTRISTAKDTPFYAILFTLVMWGPHPWMWSGFLHLKAIGNVIPYPSAFSIACTLIVWGWAITLEGKNKWVKIFSMAVISGIVLLSNPQTGMGLVAGLGAIALSRFANGCLMPALLICGAVVGGFGLAQLWPYYPFFDVVAPGKSVSYHLGNYWMYHNVLLGMGPALLGLPLIISRLRYNRYDPIGYMAVVFSIIYVYGYITKNYGYGRIIVQIMFILHFVLGEWFARAIEMTTSGKLMRFRTAMIFKFTRAVIIAMSLYFLALGIYRFHPGRDSTYESLTFLKDYVSSQDVVITGLDNADMVPSFGGKVIATSTNESFVSDIKARCDEIREFFDVKTELHARELLIKRHKARFILLSKTNPDLTENLKNELRLFGITVYRSNDHELISIASEIF